MGKRAIQRRLSRQAGKGGARPNTIRRGLRKGVIEEPTPYVPPSPVTLTAKSGGSVESYQDQVVRKFGGGQIKTKK